MATLRTRILGTILGTSVAYAIGAVGIALTGAEPTTGLYWALPLAWPVWQTAVAIGVAYDMAAGWIARRRPAPRLSLADYMPGATSSQPPVNRAA